MALRRWTIALAAFSFALTGSAAWASDVGRVVADKVSAETYRHYLDDLLYTHNGDNRDGLSGPDHDPARSNIFATLQSFGLTVELHEFSADGPHYNVVATQVGTVYPDSYYVIGGHYDSAGTPGADDNASGVAGVMEIARILSTYQTQYTIKYIAFDMEEYGLLGSEAYVADHMGDDIRGMVSMDMIAYSGGSYGCLLESLYYVSTPFRLALKAAVLEYGNGIIPTLGYISGGSDHGPFESAGYPAVLLIEGQYASNPCYHHPCDSVDRPDYIDYNFAHDMVRSVAGLLVDEALVYPVDCNDNGIPDSQEIQADPGLDCNGNGWLDVCEPHGDEDCNNNGVPDLCDVFTSTSTDCDHNGIPDECEPDCNDNGVADACDISSGTSQDCDRNGVPDECQDTSADCNDNGIWDACELDGTLLEVTFENGLPPGWSAGGLWHVTDQCSRENTCESAPWAYYGLDDTCNFNAGTTAGILVAAPFYLAGPGPVTLSYCSAYGGEGGSSPAGFDAACFAVNGVIVDDVSAAGQHLTWETRSVDLTPFVDQSVTLLWYFNSQDGIVNDGLGWQIDHIRVLAAGANDCNHNGVPDDCDVALGPSMDWNGDGVPDECQDCNGNGVADACDVPGGCLVGNCAGAPTCGTSPDCNNNGIPDECGSDDTCPPADLHWAQVPTPISTTSVTMQAEASDPYGVQYYIAGTGAGAHSRDWSADPTFTDTGLQVNRNYSYRVKARDLSPLQNETPYSDAVQLATFIETPTALNLSAITDTSMQVTAPGTFTRLTANLSGLFFDVTKLNGEPAGGPQANTWVKVQTITVVGLTSGTTYRFRVKARNYYGQNETPWYPLSGYVTQTTTGLPPCIPCGDLDHDEDVDYSDYVLLRDAIGHHDGEPAYVPCADSDGDQVVTLADYQAWLQCYRQFIGDPFAPPPAPCRRGDMNGDGLLNGLDIDGFIRAKLGGARMPGDNPACADYGGGLEQDITAFVADLLGP